MGKCVTSIKNKSRILVLGCPGSGKSSFAKKLEILTGIPAFSMDDLYWEKEWTRPNERVFWQRLATILATSCWILEGDYHHKYLEERLKAADTIIFLDIPRRTAFFGIVKRSLVRLTGDTTTLPMRVALNPQYRPRWEFRPRLIWLVLSYQRRQRPGLLTRLAELQTGKEVIILSSRQHVQTWMREIA